MSQASAIAVAPGMSERVIVGTNSGKILYSDAALSGNASTNWTWSQPRPGFVTWVAFEPADTDVVYATYGGFGGAHLYRSRDGGQSFESLGAQGAFADPGRARCTACWWIPAGARDSSWQPISASSSPRIAARAGRWRTPVSRRSSRSS